MFLPFLLKGFCGKDTVYPASLGECQDGFSRSEKRTNFFKIPGIEVRGPTGQLTWESRLSDVRYHAHLNQQVRCKCFAGILKPSEECDCIYIDI